MTTPSLPRRIFSALWNTLTRVRRALANLLFLAVLILLYLSFSRVGPAPLPKRAAMLLDPAGVVVDERSYVDPLQALLSDASAVTHEVLLRDIIDAIDFAREDLAITALVMNLDNLRGPGLSKSHEIARALNDFSASGKPVVAVGDYFTQNQYLLASHADTVILHPLGAVAIEGFSSYQNYFREALDKLAVTVHVFRAGEHKSIAEPLQRNDMSAAEKKITARWLGTLWQQYTAQVEKRRQLAAGAIDSYVNDYAGLLARANGNSAEAARSAALVDDVLNRIESNAYLVDLVGAADEEGRFEAVPFERYVARKRPGLLASKKSQQQVAVITAQGNIVPGEQPPGTIGGDSLARLIRNTAERKDIAALVLRVSSGGGSVFASEVIRQQLLKVQSQGKPVLVSMGAVAASGGYYIAANADEIWATPATITGSIGVFAAIPTVEGLLSKMGIHTDGVGTTSLAGSVRFDRPLNAQLAAALNQSVQFTYREFLQLVAVGREMPVEEVDSVAQGRVWSATDALELGLIDKLGGLEDTIAAAAARAGVADYAVDYVRLPLSPQAQLMQRLTERLGPLSAGIGSSLGGAFSSLLRPVAAAVSEITALRDPADLYVRCVGCAQAEW